MHNHTEIILNSVLAFIQWMDFKSGSFKNQLITIVYKQSVRNVQKNFFLEHYLK